MTDAVGVRHRPAGIGRWTARVVGWALAAATCASLTSRAADLPAPVSAALEAAHVPAASISVVVEEAGIGGAAGRGRGLVDWRTDAAMAPASLMKLVTTSAALDLLGPAWTWSTPVWRRGALHDGVLDGDLVVQGAGDPSLTLERLWLLLRRVRLAGVRQIHGDIVLDHGLFAPPAHAPGAFDGAPLEPYNVQPDALLLNFGTLQLRFTPDPRARVAVVGIEPDLLGVRWPEQVPLTAGPCPETWRDDLRLDMSDPNAPRFTGSGLPATCGERTWDIASPEPSSHAERLVAGLWRDMGGALDGAVRSGNAPAGIPPSDVFASPPLAEVVRSINKYSNNVMAEQVFLTLGLVKRGAGTPEAGRAVVADWLATLGGPAAAAAVVDNGSGLSRTARLSTRLLADVLQHDWAGNWMPELTASLPITGLDGTLRRTRGAVGRGHLKTGSLRDTVGIAGFVLADDGRRYVVAAVVNDPNAAAARPALDALVQWVTSRARR